jgi:hypothetical protein
MCVCVFCACVYVSVFEPVSVSGSVSACLGVCASVSFREMEGLDPQLGEGASEGPIWLQGFINVGV